MISSQCRRRVVPLVHSSRRYVSKVQADTTTKKETEKGKEKAFPYEPEPLSRPLGVLDKPSVQHQTKLERLKQVLTDDTAIAEQRKHLVKEAVTKGYFHDLNATRWNGGKTWIAPKVLIREDRSLYFPDIAGKSLLHGNPRHTTSMCIGHITILCILSTKISEIQIDAFTKSSMARFSWHPLFQRIQINLQENILKSLLVSLFLASLRRAIPVDQHATYLISSQNMEYQSEAIGLENNRVGYVYLIDENLRIRWAGCADPTADEAKALEVCTGILLKRLDNKNNQIEEQARKAQAELEAKAKGSG
ncbi:ATPase assembly factor ATP10 [Rhodocollybia butyracea]|uniref:ATPase assembly factor ATP10 n=1 Tax=Rhodocollybia butyracea TaxID=206335 RepID=A0A9P5PV62_9AGAR|nr:ATPase assembly factor ATP10 [Rhodocollybia butyracea]